MKSPLRARFWLFSSIVSLMLLLFGLSSCGGSTLPDGSGDDGSPGFSMALSPSELNVTAGDSITATLTITPQNGFSGSVNLSLVQQDGSPAPTGLTLSPTQVDVSGTTSKALQISVDSEVAPATYQLRLMGQSDSLQAHADFTLEVSSSSGDDSSPGSHWTWRSGMLGDVTYGDGTFVAVGGGILTSPDGVSWTVQDSGTDSPLSSVTYGDGTFVAVGWYGTILTSP